MWGQSVWGPEILPKPFRRASGALTVCAGERRPLRDGALRLRRGHSVRLRRARHFPHFVLQHLRLCGDSLCEDQKSFRSLSDAPPARSQSARENGDHSEMMRCACGAVTVCLCVAEDQKSFRSLSDAPPARAQSARGAADVSGVMRRASPRSNFAPSDPKYSALVSHFFK